MNSAIESLSGRSRRAVRSRDVLQRTAISHPWLIARHPGWVWSFITGGECSLVRRLVEESIRALKVRNWSDNLEPAIDWPPVTPIGLLGGPQEYLFRLVRWAKPEIVVETGIHRGVSSAFILAALESNNKGKLYSVDMPEASFRSESGEAHTSDLPPGAKTGFAVPGRLRSRWRIVLGDSRDVLEGLLTELGTIDLFYHDSEHSHDLMLWEYRTAFKHLNDRGIIASDDINWNSAFDEFLAEREVEFVRKVDGRFGVGVFPRP